MLESQVRCYSCGSQTLRYLGQLERRENFLALVNPGSLYRCCKCQLLFRYPCPSADELLNFYSQVAADVWEDNSNRPDFDLALSLITQRLHGGRVLDIGCYTGDFLERLPSSYEKYGIELSKDARQVARAKHINVISDTLDACDLTCPFFHAITLIDVIEHTSEPVELLRQAKSLLLPGGFLVLSTGDTDALTWRLMRLDYWYYWPEHISFYNKRWFQWLAAETGFKIDHIQRFSRFTSTYSQQLAQLKAVIRYRMMSAARSNRFIWQRLKSLRTILGKSSDVTLSPPFTNNWPDHMLVILKR